MIQFLAGPTYLMQELQAVALILHKMVFWLSHKVVALHLDNSPAKAYLYNQGGTASVFLSRITSSILNLANKHGIILPAYIPTHLNVEADYLSWEGLVSEFHLLSHIAQAVFQPWHQSDLLASSSGSLGVKCFQPYLDISGELNVSSFCISSHSSVHISGRTCNRSTQNTYSSGTLFAGSSLALHSFQKCWKTLLTVSYHKKSPYGYFGRLGAQGSTITAFKPLAAQRWMLHSFSCSVCQAVAGTTQATTTNIYPWGWKERAVQCAPENVQNKCHLCP